MIGKMKVYDGEYMVKDHVNLTPVWPEMNI